MPDISIMGWKCDICGKEYFENRPGYKNRYMVSIESTADSDEREDQYYSYVCQGCKTSIVKHIELLKING